MEDLPEEIRRRVVSFLPLKEAVKTTPLLSTAWRDIWRPRIVETDLSPDRIIQVIGKFLDFCDVHELLRLSCRDSDKDTKQISAAKGAERELFLNFHNNKRETRFYALKLDATGSRSFSKLPASFASLRTLHLKSVSHDFTELSQALFSECELLERLRVEQCPGLERLHITAGGRLEDLAAIDCSDLVEISISSSSLKSFTYRGPLPRMKIKNSPNVIDATVDVNSIDQNVFDCEELISLLASLRNVEILRIAGCLLEWLCLAGVIFQHLDVRFSRLQQLQISEPSLNRTKLDSLASFLDICPSLEKLNIDINCETRDVIPPYFYQYWHEPYFGSNCSKSHSRLDRLRVVEVSGFDVDEYGLWLLDLLLKRVLLLSSMTIRFHSGFVGRVVKLPSTQLSNARMNKQNVNVLCANKDYCLGFTLTWYQEAHKSELQQSPAQRKSRITTNTTKPTTSQ